MKRISIIILIFLSINIFSQIKVKSKYNDLTILKSEIVSDIISTYSVLYGEGVDSIKNYVSDSDYNLYYDSLTLWYLTNNSKYYKDKKNKTSFSKIIVETTTTVHTQTKYMLYNYLSTFYSYYKDKKISSTFCIPADYESAEIIYSYESEKSRIKYYNRNRIIRYKYSILSGKDTDLTSVLYFHKYIKPIDDHGIEYTFQSRGWIPVAYIYKKPIRKVYKSSNLFEELTGLKDTFNIDINDLKLDYKIHDKYFDIPKSELSINDGDTLTIFDKNLIDDDIINLCYGDKNNIITLSDSYEIIIDKDITDITIVALDEGKVGLCTVSIKINNKIYDYDLLKHEIININLKKENLCQNL